MREKPELLHSSCYLVARWILVWDKDPESVCITRSPKNHAPTSNQGESSMNGDGNTRDSKRYVALDIHKHYCVVAAVDREGKVVLQYGCRHSTFDWLC